MEKCYCTAASCTNTYISGGMSFFRFPKEIERCRLWISKCGRDDLSQKTSEQLNKSYYLCSEHFSRSQFMNDKKNLLIRSAVPSLFHSTTCTADTEESSSHSCNVPISDTSTSIIFPLKRICTESLASEDLHLSKSQKTSDNNGDTNEEVVIAALDATEEMVAALDATEEMVAVLDTNEGMVAVFDLDDITDEERVVLNNIVHDYLLKNYYLDISNCLDLGKPDVFHSTLAPAPSLIQLYRDHIFSEKKVDIVINDDHSNIQSFVSTGTSDYDSSSHSLRASSTIPTPDTPRRKLLEKKLRLKTNLLCKYKKRFPREKNSRVSKMRRCIELCQDILPKEQVLFFETQMKLSCVKANGRRWDDNDQTVALSLHHQSPQTYKLLQKLFCLPHPSTLRKWLSHVPIETGLNEVLFEVLEAKVKQMKPLERQCVLTLDEMALTSALAYNSSSDQVEGFVDSGDGVNERVIANEALVIMTHGLFKQFKQPICYITSRGTTNADCLTQLLLRCIKKLLLTIIYN